MPDVTRTAKLAGIVAGGLSCLALSLLVAFSVGSAWWGAMVGLLGLAGLAVAATGFFAGPEPAVLAAREIVNGELRKAAGRVGPDDDGRDQAVRDIGLLARRLITSFQNLTNTAATLACFSKDLKEQSAAISDKTAASKVMTREVTQASSGLSDKLEALDQAVEESFTAINSMAAAIEELSAAEEEISRGIDRAASGSEAASNLAARSTTNVAGLGRAAKDGVKGIEEIGRSMAEVEKRSSLLKEDMAQLGRKTQEIGRVLEVISDIADQTNLLALNAAIEAARAGDAGRGFAVVADEVRKLAEKTMVATKDVGEAITSIQAMARTNVQATEQAVEAISRSTRLAGEQIAAVGGIELEAREAVGEIEKVAAAMNAVKEEILGLSRAVREQTLANRDISANIGGVAETLRMVCDTVKDGSGAFAVIASEVRGLDENMSGIASVSLQVRASAREVADLAGELDTALKVYDLGRPGLDVGRVKTLHLAWVARLESLMHGFATLRPDQVADHHQCDFGKWFDSTGQKELGGLESFKIVGGHHEKVHALARRIVALAGEGRTDEMRRLMAEFETVRREMFAALDVLYRDSFK